jgi:hypothetical protein
MGAFRGGLPDGQGRLIAADRSLTVGTWKEGALQAGAPSRAR